MSQRLFARSPDLARLHHEGYEVVVRDNHAIIGHVPYVTEARQVAYGTLVCALTLAGDATTQPDSHVVYFAGTTPSDRDGKPLSKIINGPVVQTMAGVEVNFAFSSKPTPEGKYPDYHAQLTSYVNILEGPAQALDESATAQTHRVIEADDDEPVFRYHDSASTRVGITDLTAKLRIGPIGIVGVGGTGSYILDLLAKAPVSEIHLFDGDRFLQHNAFRSPGAPSVEDLRTATTKAEYFAAIYDRMRHGVVAHPYAITEDNVDELAEMAFVFVAVDDGPAKRTIVDALDQYGMSYVDVGMGVWRTEDQLGGVLRVTTGTAAHRGARREISMGAVGRDDEYNTNIQIADLNAVNAGLAVIKFKKLMGFYADFEGEHSTVYDIDGNHLHNDERHR